MATHLVFTSLATPPRPLWPRSGILGVASSISLPSPSPSTSTFSVSSSPSMVHRNLRIKRKAVEQKQVYDGVYGPWTIEDSDVREVIFYRCGLVAAASAFVIAASSAFLRGDFLFGNIIERNLDILYAIGAGGLGLSLLLIHIYVTEIKRTLQLLWLLGIIGSIATNAMLARPSDMSLVDYVIQNPSAVWFVGPLFAALTGLVFKEGLCYGKLEAGILTFVIPIVLLGHLTGVIDDSVKTAMLGTWMALFVIFAGRKFTQPIKDDIGDKSVFMFNSLPEDEKKRVMDSLERQKLGEK